MPEVFKESEGKPEVKIDQMVLQNLQNRGCSGPEQIMQLARDSIKGRQVDVPKNEQENFRYARDMLAFVPQLEAKGYTTHEAHELVENTRTPADMIFFSSTRLSQGDYDVGVLQDKFKYIREHPEANFRDATIATMFKGPKVVPEFRKPAEEQKPVIASVPKKLAPVGKGEMDDLLFSQQEIALAQVKGKIEKEILSKRNNDREEAALIMQYAFHWAKTGKDLGPVEDDFKEDYEFARAAIAFMPGLVAKGYHVDDARSMVENAMLPESMKVRVENANEKDAVLIADALAGKKENEPIEELAFSGPVTEEKVAPGEAPPKAATEVASAQKYMVEVRGAKYFVTLNAPLEGNMEDEFLKMVRTNPGNITSFQMGERTMEQGDYLRDFIANTFADLYENAYKTKQVDVKEM